MKAQKTNIVAGTVFGVHPGEPQEGASSIPFRRVESEDTGQKEKDKGNPKT